MRAAGGARHGNRAGRVPPCRRVTSVNGPSGRRPWRCACCSRGGCAAATAAGSVRPGRDRWPTPPCGPACRRSSATCWGPADDLAGQGRGARAKSWGCRRPWWYRSGRTPPRDGLPGGAPGCRRFSRALRSATRPHARASSNVPTRLPARPSAHVPGVPCPRQGVVANDRRAGAPGPSARPPWWVWPSSRLVRWQGRTTRPPVVRGAGRHRRCRPRSTA